MRLTRSALVALVCLALAPAGCGGDITGGGDGGRSATAYCKAFYSKAASIRQGYVDAGRTMQRDPLSGMAKLLSAPGDLAAIFDGMVDHAPDEIRSDTVQVRDSFKKLQDNLGESVKDPLGALGKNMVNALSASGSFERVDAYLGDHCPVDSALAQQYIRAAG